MSISQGLEREGICGNLCNTVKHVMALTVDFRATATEILLPLVKLCGPFLLFKKKGIKICRAVLQAFRFIHFC